MCRDTGNSRQLLHSEGNLLSRLLYLKKTWGGWREREGWQSGGTGGQRKEGIDEDL